MIVKKRKSQDPRITNRSQRGGEFTAESLKGQVELLRDRCQELTGLARLMEREGIQSVWVDGQSKVARANKLVREFTINMEKSVKRAIVQKEYGAE